MSRNAGSTIILFFIFKNRKHKIYSKGHKVCTFCTRFSNFYIEIMLLSIFEKKIGEVYPNKTLIMQNITKTKEK